MVLSLILHKHYVNNSGLLLVVLLYLDKVLGQFCKPKDCIDLKCYRVSTAKRGVYIYPNSTSLPKVLVTCQQTGDGGGWIVYMRRIDGSVHFNTTWDDYKNGFGQQGRNYESWLGNENVHQLEKTFDGGAQLRVEGYIFNGTSCFISADNFRLEDESDKYRLRFGAVTGKPKAIETDWKHHKGLSFSTADHEGRAAICNIYKGGWWYRRCHLVYLTGWYPMDPQSIAGLYHTMYFTHFATIPFTEVNMLFRPMVTTRVCNNPCQHNGVCEYVESTNNYHCACPETHCGLHCEKKYPCKNNGTCVYSAKTKNISCVCGASYTGTLCEVRVTTTTTMTTTTANTTTPTTPAEPPPRFVVIIGAFSLIFLIILVGTVVMMHHISKKKHAREEEERRKQEEKESEEGEAADDDTMFGFLDLSSMFGQ